MQQILIILDTYSRIGEVPLMQTKKAPYACHILVCTRSRDGEQKACGDADSGRLKSRIKDEIADRGWKGRVRVSDTGCLGVCAAGPNVMIYPQQIWFSRVTEDDLSDILARVTELIA